MIIFSKREDIYMRKGIVILLICFMSVGLCSCSQQERGQSLTKGFMQMRKQVEGTLLAVFKEQYVEIKEQGKLYDEQQHIIGTIEQGTILKGSDKMINEYLGIAGTSWYVDAKAVNHRFDAVKKRNHLDKLQEVKTKAKAKLYDETGKLAYTLEQEQSFTMVINQPSKVGVLLDETVYFVAKDEVESDIAIDIENTNEVPVLMYHFFYSEAAGETRGDGNFVEEKEFAEQLDNLQTLGYATLTMSELKYYLNNEAKIPEKSVVISIDDGSPSVYKYAYPILKEHQMNATLFLITGWLGESLPEEFKIMRSDGLELQSHGYLTHQGGCDEQHGGKLLCIGIEDGVADTKQSMEFVGGAFVYCYPFGDVNEHAISILEQAGIELAFTTKNGKVNPNLDKYQLPRIRVSGGAGIARFLSALQ